jgi:hypothetical protein
VRSHDRPHFGAGESGVDDEPKRDELQGVIHELDPDADGQPWDNLNEGMESAVRNFHVVARGELGVEDAEQRRDQAHAEPI